MTRAWKKLAQPEGLALIALLYGIAGIVGFAQIIDPVDYGPPAEALTGVSGWLLLVGAAVAGMCAIVGWWGGERPFIFFALLGIVTRSIATGFCFSATPHEAVTRGGLVLLSAGWLLLRLLLILGADFDPTRGWWGRNGDA